MQHILDHIASIESKIQLLNQKCESLTNEVDSLKKENRELKESLDIVSKESERLKQEYRSLEVQNQVNMTDELSVYKKTVKKELDDYLKKIDHCIELVNQS